VIEVDVPEINGVRDSLVRFVIALMMLVIIHRRCSLTIKSMQLCSQADYTTVLLTLDSLSTPLFSSVPSAF